LEEDRAVAGTGAETLITVPLQPCACAIEAKPMVIVTMSAVDESRIEPPHAADHD
jgi:hypothetical protein